MKSVICIIPARGGSKGLPKKNTLLMGGVPLIKRAIRDAIESNVCDVVLVTTDDEEIRDIAISAGAECPFLRPENLSGDHATTEATLQHALLSYEKHSGRQFDTCVFITPTDVFRRIENIQDVVKKLHADNDLESVFVVHPTHKNYWEIDDNDTKVRLRSWMASYSSRQIRQPIFREDTGLGCASRSELWRDGKRIGDKVDFVINQDEFSSIDIHTINDLALANAALEILDKK